MNDWRRAETVFGLYVHVPFCVSRCRYCDFHSEARQSIPWPAFLTALRRELSARGPAFAEQAWATLYFGGGTPSLAPGELFTSVASAARELFGDPDALEMTLEANPQDVGAEAAIAWRRAGCNRLSLGWQSATDRFLALLGRRHDVAEGRQAVRVARRAGFDNLSLDLIFALPGQTLAELDADIEAALAHEPEHISLYALTYHAGTPLWRARQRGELTPVEEELEVEMMSRIEERLGAAGYEHYEVANFARPGRRATHNSLYWAGARYLGLGPGAHSFWHQGWAAARRWEGRRDLEAYLGHWGTTRPAAMPEVGDAGCEAVESLAPKQLMQERMLCALRTHEGIRLDEPALRPFAAELAEGIATAIARGWATEPAGRLVPTRTGLLHADALAELFF